MLWLHKLVLTLLIFFEVNVLSITKLKNLKRSPFFLNSFPTFVNTSSRQNDFKRCANIYLKKRLDPNDKYTLIKRHEAKIQRNLKRKYLIERCKEKRQMLKKYIENASSPIEYVYWKAKLAKMPRDSCPVRYRNRCAITGRARGVYSFFGLCRHQARHLIQNMFFPGFVKASW